MTFKKFRTLSKIEIAALLAPRLADQCAGALRQFKRDFPNQQIPEGGFQLFVALVVAFNTMTQLPPGLNVTPDWSRAQMRFAPPNQSAFGPACQGELFLGFLRMFGPLTWGWRSPDKEKGKGVLRRGILQIVADHFAAIDDHKVFLIGADWKSSTSCKELAKSFLALRRQTPTPVAIEQEAGTFFDLIARLDRHSAKVIATAE